MGIIKFFSKSSFDNGNITLPNPDPANYSIIRSKVIGKHLVIEIKYHDCINYEGHKIMVYECCLNDLIKQKIIDPHFTDNKNYFSPTGILL